MSVLRESSPLENCSPRPRCSPRSCCSPRWPSPRRRGAVGALDAARDGVPSPHNMLRMGAGWATTILFSGNSGVPEWSGLCESGAVSEQVYRIQSPGAAGCFHCSHFCHHRPVIGGVGYHGSNDIRRRGNCLKLIIYCEHTAFMRHNISGWLSCQQEANFRLSHKNDTRAPI